MQYLLSQDPGAVEAYCVRNTTNGGLCADGKDPVEPYVNYFWTIGNVGYLIFLEGGVALWILMLFLYNRYWWRYHSGLKQTSMRRNQAERCSSDLLRFFVPSAKIRKHRFRGLKEKSFRVDIKFKHLALQLHKDDSERGRLLRDCTGEFKSERMAAIMGPSGAGKTTLLNTLCGKATYGKTSGEILINNQPGDMADFKDIVGFVPQDDIVHEFLTVRENLMVAAKLKNKEGTDKLQLEIVEDVLNVMQITHIQQTIVGGAMAKGISGGQRKRVNIGLELCGAPTLLFLDEPTSGLDSTTALAVVHCLKVLAGLGLTMVMSIHQPRYRLFELFDDVCMLLKGGFTAYFGPAHGAIPWFESLGFRMPEHENPADWFMDVCSNEAERTVENEALPAITSTGADAPGTDAPAVAPAPAGRQDRFTRQWSGTHEIRTAWAEQGNSFLRRVRSQRSRDWTPADDDRVLMRNLEQQWDLLTDHPEQGLDGKQFRACVKNCTGTEYEEEAIDMIWNRITNTDVITKEAFHKYLRGLLNVCSETVSETSDPVQKATLPPIASAGSLQEEDIDALEEEIRNDAGSGSRNPNEDPLLEVVESQMPGFWTQFRTVFHRRILNWWRNIIEMCFFFGLAFFVGLVTGFFAYLMFLDPGLIEEVYACWIFQLITALMVALKASFLFEEKVIFWRERNRGLNVFAFFSAQVLVDMVFVEIPMSLVFVGTFYCCYVAARPYPQTSLFSWYIPARLLTFVAAGWGYAISALFPTRLASVGAVIVLFICMAVGSPPVVHHFVGDPILEWFVFPVVTRWSTQWTTLAAIQAEREDQWNRPDCVGNETMKEVSRLGQKMMSYTYTRCEDGTFGPNSFTEVLMSELHRSDAYDSLRQRYIMSYAADFMESRINDAYEGGMLAPLFGEYGAIVAVLATQSFILFAACYLVLRYGYWWQQI